MARLSGDTFGRVLRRHAERNRVDLRASAAATEPTTLAVVSLDEEGRASYDFYLDATADWQWSAEELARLPDQTTILHTGSLASWTPPGGDLIATLVRRVRAAGEIVLSYDPNVRPRLLGAPERGQALVERNVAAAHVVKASDEDLRWLYPDKWPATVAADWLNTRGRPGRRHPRGTGRDRLHRPHPSDAARCSRHRAGRHRRRWRRVHQRPAQRPRRHAPRRRPAWLRSGKRTSPRSSTTRSWCRR